MADRQIMVFIIMEAVYGHLFGRRCGILKSRLQNRFRIINKPAYTADQKSMFIFHLTVQAGDKLNGWPGAGCQGAPFPPCLEQSL